MRIFKSKSSVFGKNIPAACEYCANSAVSGCIRHKSIKNGRCAAFSYDPLRRVPKNAPPLYVPDAKEFEL